MRIPHITSPVLFAVFISASIWTVLVVTAPLMVPSGTLEDLSGVVGGHENEDQFDQLSPLPHAVYWLGDAECHQLANRSLFLNDIVTFYRYKINPVYVLIGLVPIGIDGGLQAVTSYESNNFLRMVTGLVAGFVLSLMLAHFLFAIQEDRDEKR
jgi:Predicted membrane protein (DUF2085)